MELPVINTISTDIKDLSIYLRSIKKFGKSTLFRDVILRKYGDPSYGLHVQCGKERGGKLLDNDNATRVTTYEDILELKEYLINKRMFKRDEKGKILKNEYVSTPNHVQICCLDTADELIPIFEAYTLKVDAQERGKKAKSINGAMGGYQEGQRFTANLIKNFVDDLFEAGIGVWVVAHTKMKTIREKGGLEEDGYQQLTSNLVSAYESAFGDIFDATFTGVIDRNVEIVKAKNENEKDKRYATEEVRKLYFRGTTLIDAGGRFADGAVPDYMVFENGKDNASEFIRIIEEGMEKSKTKPVSTHKPTPKPTPVPEPIVEEPIIEDDIDDIDTAEEEIIEETPEIDVEELRADIRGKFKTCTDKNVKAAVKTKIQEYGKLDDLDLEVLLELKEMFK